MQRSAGRRNPGERSLGLKRKSPRRVQFSGMKDLKDPRLLWLKAGLFVAVGLVSTILVLLENPTVRTGLFLGLAIWAFCRAYYFAFYVIEHYIDPKFKYAGLWAFVRRKSRPRI